MSLTSVVVSNRHSAGRRPWVCPMGHIGLMVRMSAGRTFAASLNDSGSAKPMYHHVA
jgi:hypothetical protein